MEGCKHYLKTEENEYSGTLIQRDERSKFMFTCHKCWKVFDTRKLKTKKVLSKGKNKMTKYVITKKDRKEVKSLLIFLSGVTEKTPIKNISFTKSKLNDRIVIQRWDDENKNTFTEIIEIIKK